MANFFDLMASLGVGYTQEESEWKALTVGYENTPANQRDTAAYRLALDKYSEVSTAFFAKYPEQTRIAKLVQ